MTRFSLFLFVALFLAIPSAMGQFFPVDSAFRPLSTQIPTALSLPQVEVPLERDPFWVTTEVNVNSTGMIFDDCNRDGFIDVFIANGNDIVLARNAVYLSNQGTLPTSASWYSDNSEYSGHCAVGDIDDNGWPDFLVANFLGQEDFSTPAPLNLYSNFDGVLNTSPDWYSADSAFTFSCVLGDFDNDGDLDLATANGTGYTSTYTSDRLYLNVDGAFETLPSWQTDAHTAAIDVTCGDIDNDGDLDLAFCYDHIGTAVYYNNDGDLSTTPGWQSGDGESANTLIFADVNNDGWLDLIVAFNRQLSGGGYFRVYFNDGTGHLNTDPGWQSSTGGYGSALSVYDYDADGDDDLATGRWFDEVKVYENTGGTYTLTPVWQSNVSVAAEELAWVDIDRYGVEPMADTIPADGDRKLFYLRHHPMYSIDSVLVDDALLDHPDFCFDLISAWVSLAEAPTDSLVVYYQYSFANDLAVSDWDDLNMAFSNTFNRIRMYAEPTLGWTPLTVQFSDSSSGTTEWLWQFGDGESSAEKNPTHIYYDGGGYDVSLGVRFTEGWYERTMPNMVMVLADTIVGSHDTASAGGSIEVVVYARNSYPVRYIRLPFEFAGDLGVQYDSFSTVGCRTEYFETQTYLNYDPFNKRNTLKLLSSNDGSAPELAPGAGPIVKLFFTIPSSALPDQILAVRLDGYNDYLPILFGSVIDVEPVTIDGLIAVSCCRDIRGNIDGDVTEIVDVNDVQYFIDWMFLGGPPPMCLNEVDVTANGRMDIDDLLALIDYVYKSGPPPSDCD